MCPYTLQGCLWYKNKQNKKCCVRFTGAVMLYLASAVGTQIYNRNSIKRLLEAIASLLFWDQSLVSSGRWEIKGPLLNLAWAHFHRALGWKWQNRLVWRAVWLCLHPVASATEEELASHRNSAFHGGEISQNWGSGRGEDAFLKLTFIEV